MRRFFRRLSPWHRGYEKGYAAALRAVENGLKLSADIATAYGHQTVDDAARAIARTLSGGRN